MKIYGAISAFSGWKRNEKEKREERMTDLKRGARDLAYLTTPNYEMST